MRIEEIVKGGIIEVEVKCDGQTVHFNSEVVEIIPNSLLVKAIKVKEQSIGFSDHCRINLLYLQDEKLNLWENAAIKLVKYNNEVYHMIEVTGEGKPYNRRSSFRIYIGEDMQLIVYSANGPTAISVLIKDISETGIAFLTKEELGLSQTIRLKIMDNDSAIHLAGSIIRKEFIDSLGKFLYGCKLSEKNTKLAKYISKKQNDLLRKKSSNTPEPLTPLLKDKKAKKMGSVNQN